MSGTKYFEEALNAVKFLGLLKKFGSAQNILGPVKGQGISKKLTTAPSSVIVVSANMDIPLKAEIHECFICKNGKFPTNESLVKHLSNVHKKIISKRKKCFGKNISGMTIPEKVSHLINSYENRGNKTKVDCNPIQKKLEVELVSKELNHLAAIWHVYAGGLNFMK